MYKTFLPPDYYKEGSMTKTIQIVETIGGKGEYSASPEMKEKKKPKGAQIIWPGTSALL